MKKSCSAAKQLHYALIRAKGIPVHINTSGYLDFADQVKSVSLTTSSDSDLREHLLKGGIVHRFASVCEASRRILGLDPYSEQIAAAKILSENKLVQMQTGEGKTLAAIFPALVYAAGGGRTHILTANEYLAERDAVWMGDVYRFFGVSVSSISENMPADEKKAAYGAQVVYLTAKQSGFDYLHDGLQLTADTMVHKPFDRCIVDEADFIMIDEARIPLVIARSRDSSPFDYKACDITASGLEYGTDFIVDRAGRKCVLTSGGINRVCDRLNIEETTSEGRLVISGVNVALHARHLLKRDVDYIVRDGQIELVDGFTGRVADKREWPYGIQRALEVLEGNIPKPEGEICGRITISDFINLYPQKSAMTATGEQAAAEFYRTYGLETVIIRPHREVIREDLPDMVFRTLDAKYAYMLKLVRECKSKEQPVLIGTATVRESVEVSGILSEAGIGHKVLNAEQDAREAEIIAAAGAPGAVTVATNMAGRGTDIRLGGTGSDRSAEVKAAGGLFIIGLNRFESSRVDDQLRGRSGRQGDPGCSQFLLSLEDELFIKYGISEFLPEGVLDFKGDRPVTDKKAGREIARAQQIIEDQHSKMRQTLNNYSAVIESCRKRITEDRFDALLKGEVPISVIEALEAAGSEIADAVDPAAAAGIFADEIDKFWTEFLDWNETLKEGIYLRRLGGKEPLFEYIRDVRAFFSQSYGQVSEKAAAGIIASAGRQTASGDDENPGSTWTYMIDDNPFPSFSLSLLGMDAAVGAAAASVLLLFSPVLLLNWLSGRFGRKKGNNNIKKS